jgi:hypothetical protein
MLWAAVVRFVQETASRADIQGPSAAAASNSTGSAGERHQLPADVTIAFQQLMAGNSSVLQLQYCDLANQPPAVIYLQYSGLCLMHGSWWLQAMLKVGV